MSDDGIFLDNIFKTHAGKIGFPFLFTILGKISIKGGKFGESNKKGPG